MKHISNLPHNPDYVLVSTRIDSNEVVYGISNTSENEGMELYFYKKGLNHCHYSKRYVSANIPNKHKACCHELTAQAINVKPGNKLIIQ
jgi:hypothetical protein